MTKWNELHTFTYNTVGLIAGYDYVSMSLGPYSLSETLGPQLPRAYFNKGWGLSGGGQFSLTPFEMGFPNVNADYTGTLTVVIRDPLTGEERDRRETAVSISIAAIADEDADPICPSPSVYDWVSKTCKFPEVPEPPPTEPEEPAPPPSEGLPWPVNKLFDALWLIVGPFVVELEKLLKRIFAGPLVFLGEIVDGILAIPETIVDLGAKIKNFIDLLDLSNLPELWDKLIELGYVNENWRLPTWDDVWIWLGTGFSKHLENAGVWWNNLLKGATDWFTNGINYFLKLDVTKPFIDSIHGSPEGAGINDWEKFDAPLSAFIGNSIKHAMLSFEKDVTDVVDGSVEKAVEKKEEILGKGSRWFGDMIGYATIAEMVGLGQLEAPSKIVDVLLAAHGLVIGSMMEIPIRRGFLKPLEYAANERYRPEIPAYQDLINMVVKEVLPLEGDKSFKKYLGLLGYSDDFSQLIWDAHFIPPTRTELLRAHWRGKLSAEALTKLEVLVDLDPRFREINGETGTIPLTAGGEGAGDFDIWEDLRYIDPSREEIRYMFETAAIETEEEFTGYLRRLGYREEDLPKLVNYGIRFQERFFRRRYLIALAQGYRLGTVTEEELKEGFKEAHYTEAVADWVIKAEEVRKDFRGDSREREATLARAIAWYIGGFIEESDLKERLEGLGYAETEIDIFLEEANDKIEAKKEKIEEKIVLFSRPQLDSLLKDKTITEETYKTRMLEMGWKDETITEWLNHLQAPEVVTEDRQVTASRVLNWLKKDVLDEAETRSRLTVLKYAPDDIDNFIEETNLAKVEPQKDILQSEAASAYRVGAIDETTFKNRLWQLGRTVDAINLIVATEGLKQKVTTQDFSRAQWDKLFKSGIITENEYRSRLGVLGYTPQGVEYWVALQKAGMFEKERTLSQAQIIDVWEKSQKDLVWFNRVVLGAETGEAATIEILEEWTIMRLRGWGMNEGDARILLEMEREEVKQE